MLSVRNTAAMSSLLVLIACGGGGGGVGGNETGGSGGGGDGGPDITPNPDLVYADDQPVTRESFVGKTFPIQLVIGSDRDGDTPRRETATIEYITVDRAIVTYDGRSTEFTFTNQLSQENWSSGALNSGGGPLQDLRLDRVTRSARGIAIGNDSIANPDLPLAEGTFGFVTPENRLTGSVNYSSDFGARMLITATDWIDQGDGTFARVERIVEADGKSVSIDVDFGTGLVSGTLFDGSYQTTDDRQFGAKSVSHDVTVTLENATVSGSGFTGDVSVETVASTNPSVNGDIQSSTVVMNSQDAEGTFFGYNAEGVGGTFEANFDETFFRGDNPFGGVDAEEVTENRTIVGDFIVNN